MSKKPEKKSATDFVVTSNTKSLGRYAVSDRFEAGMILMGSEVKSLRAKKADLEGAYASIDHGELFLHKMFIGPYAQATSFGHETKRSRKLLAHGHEIEKLTGKLAQRGYTLIPTQVYFKAGRAKVELGLAKPKDMEDRREDIKKKLDLREAKVAMSRGKGGGR